MDNDLLRAAHRIMRRLRLRARVFVVLKPDGRIVVLSLSLLLLAACGAPAGAQPAARPTAPRATPSPSLTDAFEVLGWRLEDERGVLYAVGELRNTGRTPAGPKLIITAYGADGQVVDSANCWPASTSNVPAGETWPIDCPVTDRPGVVRATLRVVDAEAW